MKVERYEPLPGLFVECYYFPVELDNVPPKIRRLIERANPSLAKDPSGNELTEQLASRAYSCNTEEAKCLAGVLGGYRPVGLEFSSRSMWTLLTSPGLPDFHLPAKDVVPTYSGFRDAEALTEIASRWICAMIGHRAVPYFGEMLYLGGSFSCVETGVDVSKYKEWEGSIFVLVTHCEEESILLTPHGKTGYHFGAERRIAELPHDFAGLCRLLARYFSLDLPLRSRFDWCA